MQIREWLKNNPVIGGAIVAGIMLTAILILVLSLLPTNPTPASTPNNYYYDMQSGELFVADVSLIPPIKAPSGGEGVLAQVYACGECGDDSELFVGILRKYSPAGKQAIENDMPPGVENELVRLTDEGSRWVPADSEPGRAYRLQAVADAKAACKGKKPKICFPE